MWCFALLAFPLHSAQGDRGAGTGDGPDSLKLLISAEQAVLTAPFPARITLYLHNAGQETVWLYRRVRDRATGGPRVDGSTLVVHLDPVGSERGQGRPPTAVPAQGTVLESPGLPRPKLVRLAPGEDYEEKTVIRLVPAKAEVNGGDKPIWGRYRLRATYGAKYSNADTIARNLGAVVWQGEVTSNTIEVELLPPAGQASVAGSVVGPNTRPVSEVCVSLSNEQERLIDQVVTDSEGRFSFTHLPFGLYWVTVRQEPSPEDTVVFRHVEVTLAAPAGTIDFVMLPREIHEPRDLLHKPVLFRVTDSEGRPLGKVQLEVTWSNGIVVDNVKGDVAEDGSVALELIPGLNFVTLKRRGCASEDYRADVAPGGGIDGSKFAFECAQK